jgi:hypothetical protein
MICKKQILFTLYKKQMHFNRAPETCQRLKRIFKEHIYGDDAASDRSSPECVWGKKWDSIVTMDDATDEHYGMSFTDQAETSVTFQGGMM